MCKFMMYITWCFDTHIYCKIMTTRRLVHSPFLSHNYLCCFLLATFKYTAQYYSILSLCCILDPSLWSSSLLELSFLALVIASPLALVGLDMVRAFGILHFSLCGFLNPANSFANSPIIYPPWITIIWGHHLFPAETLTDICIECGRYAFTAWPHFMYYSKSSHLFYEIGIINPCLIDKGT